MVDSSASLSRAYLKAVIRYSFLQCVQDRHKKLTSSGSRVGLGAEADFPGNNKWAKFPLGQVVVRRNITILSPVVKPLGLFTKYILDLLNGWMLGLTIGDIDNFIFDFSCLTVEFSVRKL